MDVKDSDNTWLNFSKDLPNVVFSVGVFKLHFVVVVIADKKVETSLISGGFFDEYSRAPLQLPQLGLAVEMTQFLVYELLMLVTDDH